MAEDLIDHLGEMVRPLFRPDAAVTMETTPDGGCLVSAGWRMGSSRMDNWSKEIHLRLPPVVMERYGKLNEKGRARADANLVSYVKLKLGAFRPEHDRPRYLLPPVEIWEMKYEDMFPK